MWPPFPGIFSLHSKVYSFSCEVIGERDDHVIISQNFKALKNPSTFLPPVQHFQFKDKVIDNQRDLRAFWISDLLIPVRHAA